MSVLLTGEKHRQVCPRLKRGLRLGRWASKLNRGRAFMKYRLLHVNNSMSGNKGRVGRVRVEFARGSVCIPHLVVRSIAKAELLLDEVAEEILSMPLVLLAVEMMHLGLTAANIVGREVLQKGSEVVVLFSP